MEKNYRAELVGVFGDPVDDNPTGVMEEAAFEACGGNLKESIRANRRRKNILYD